MKELAVVYIYAILKKKICLCNFALTLLKETNSISAVVLSNNTF